jgi:hypothetical protein
MQRQENLRNSKKTVRMLLPFKMQYKAVNKQCTKQKEGITKFLW